MIFVALGTQKFQFNRLLKKIDQMLEEKKISGEVFAQVGYSDYRPQNFRYTPFLNQQEFKSKIQECDLLITHSGVATIIEGLKHDKRVIVVPRLKKYREHVDNHQIQIAEAFSTQNYVMMCSEEDSLEKLVHDAEHHQFAKYVSQREQVVKTIMDYLR